MKYSRLKFDYARESLRYLVKIYNIKDIYIPYYLCDVIRHMLFEEGVKIHFYHIDDKFLPEKSMPEDCYLLYPNYFGICDKNVDILKKIYPNLIVDNAHSYYSEPQGFACFNAEHKFKSTDKGSYLWIKKEGSSIEDHTIETFPLYKKENFIKLHKKYSSINLLDIDLGCKSPFCYPLLVETEDKANEIVKSLTKEGKTIYRYWNNLPKSYNEYKFYSRLIPIPLF